ncbi:MAG: CRISPR-associated helicase Cas3' [Gracilibacteraceae bacterium]|jgi:CRISPR-associated endonuclease/helicase Cas3|nr:CRISPR-associated helicase Cas3' [Gracilibacteraceae bacterium]
MLTKENGKKPSLLGRLEEAKQIAKEWNPAKSLWAKTEHGGKPWIPLYAHMAAAAAAAETLLDVWLSGGPRDILERSANQDTAEKLFVFLAAAHDLGKATPMFQFQPGIGEDLRSRVSDAGFPAAPITGKDWRRVKHATASQAILEKHGIDRSVAVVLGGHHGKPPSTAAANSAARNTHAQLLGFDSEEWRAAQHRLYCYALELSGIDEAALKRVRLSAAQQMIYTGAVIMADWIASGEGDVKLPERWDIVDVDFDETPYDFKFRFGFDASAVQSMVIDALTASAPPGIMIIEAPMGSGKTEAALAGAEIMASKTERSGVYFGLPTQATADGIFLRFIEWVGKVSDSENPHSFFLAHGKSAYNTSYAELRRYNVSADDESDDKTKGKSAGSVYVNDWTTGRKKGLLADFAVGTIDQLLMCALKQKHVALRHLGFANKVAIIDEVHAFDAYMDSYLYMALRWLGEYGVPVVVLSATLPPVTRQKLIESYAGREFSEKVYTGDGFKSKLTALIPPNWAKTEAYPLITYTDGGDVEQLYPAADPKRAVKVDIERFGSTAAEVCEKLQELLADGGCAGIVVNTVAKAQNMAAELSAVFGGECVRLLHSAFISLDRTEKEAELLAALGPPGAAKTERPGKLIVVGTQVIEQSLDIDFDVLFTEICPIDLLIQRIGRLHRHKRAARPARLAAPTAYVMGCDEFDGGSAAIYGEYMLMTTKYLLPDRLYLPENIAQLVGAAYGDGAEVPDGERADYEFARKEHEERIATKESRAGAFQLREPTKGRNDLTGALDSDSSDKTGEATVRDGENSIEVILLRFVGGKYRLLPWIDGGRVIPTDSAPAAGTAFTLAGCKIRLPRMFSKVWTEAKTIEELEKKGAVLQKAWRENPWLNGELFLALDENLEATLCERTVKYDKNIGFTAKKEG